MRLHEILLDLSDGALIRRPKFHKVFYLTNSGMFLTERDTGKFPRAGYGLDIEDLMAKDWVRVELTEDGLKEYEEEF